MYYYSMSIPEIMVLMFVLFLWVLSIFFFFKRYEKINTIERADIPASLMASNYQRKASFGTTASTVSLKNLPMNGCVQANSAACLVENSSDMILDHTNAHMRQHLLSKHHQAKSEDTSSLARMMHFSDLVNLNNYQQRRVSGPDSYNYFNNAAATAHNEQPSSPTPTAAVSVSGMVMMSPSSTHKNLKYFKQAHGKYAKRLVSPLARRDDDDLDRGNTEPNANNSCGSRESQLCNSNMNLARIVVDPFLNYRLLAVSKSSSVPNFKSENSKPMISPPADHKHISELNERDTSTEFITVTLPESDSFNNNPASMFSSTATPTTIINQPTINMTSEINTSPPSHHHYPHHYSSPPRYQAHHIEVQSAPKSEQLLDPRLIPMSVRKSLLGLHQKSMLNLLNKSMLGLNEEHGNNNAAVAANPVANCSSTLAPTNNLLKKYSRNQASLYDLSKTASHLRV